MSRKRTSRKIPNVSKVDISKIPDVPKEDKIICFWNSAAGENFHNSIFAIVFALKMHRIWTGSNLLQSSRSKCPDVLKEDKICPFFGHPFQSPNVLFRDIKSQMSRSGQNMSFKKTYDPSRFRSSLQPWLLILGATISKKSFTVRH